MTMIFGISDVATYRDSNIVQQPIYLEYQKIEEYKSKLKMITLNEGSVMINPS